jgi:multidrug efflux pump subunit AcrA (membrane-fusion protein)
MNTSATATRTPPPRRRGDLVLGAEDPEGFRVVKATRTGDFFRLGPEESFLLDQLDGTRGGADIRAGFEARFGRPLSEEELEQFLAVAGGNGLLEAERPADPPAPPTRAPSDVGTASSQGAPDAPAAQSLLRLRFKLFDPDRFFGWLCPRIAFVWTAPFAAVSLALIAAAGLMAWGGREEYVAHFESSLTWRTMALVWLTLLAATLLHEFAHGLTCKRFGGEVREVGLLLIYLMPGMYCNVSDAWLFPSRGKRLLVTAAGCWCDLLVWSFAVFGWRLTPPGSFLNDLLWVTLSVLGARVLINVNPLIRLDGYYFLSDLVGVPNLQQQGMARVTAYLRWLLWGAARPQPDPRAGVLLGYGLANWLFGVSILAAVLASMMQLLGDRWGAAGALAVLVLGFFLMRSLLSGLDEGEVGRMLRGRHARALTWAGVVTACLGYLAFGTWEDRSAGTFQVRSAQRAEVRAPVTAFLQEVCVAEGEFVREGAVLARLHVPNLGARLRQARAEVEEAEARLALLLAGARSEERESHQRRVERAEQALARARAELTRALEAFSAELDGMASQLDAAQVEADHARASLQRARRLRLRQAVSEEGYADAHKRWGVATAQATSQAAQCRARRAAGAREAEQEVARRERELAEARSAVTLVEAEPRREEVRAERARLARAREEVAFLERVEAKLRLVAPRAGLVTTPNLADRVGQYLREGDLFCTVEEPGGLEAEVVLLDQESRGVRPGQEVQLRPRDNPRLTLRGTVLRVAPRAARGGPEPAGTTSAVTAYCAVEGAADDLRPGTLGHARIQRGRRPLREWLCDKGFQLLRAEFWW